MSEVMPTSKGKNIKDDARIGLGHVLNIIGKGIYTASNRFIGVNNLITTD